MRQQSRRSLAVGGMLVSALAVWACETTRNPGGIQRDLTQPVVTLSNAAGDTQNISGGLRFQVSAVDNLALKSVNLSFSGGLIGTLDTTFTGTVKAYNVTRTLTFPANSGAGGGIQIVARATDGAGNSSTDTLFIFLSNVQALRVTLVLPSPGALASTGKGIPVDIIAVQKSGIAKVGFIVSPASSVTNPTVPPRDSIVFSTPLADSVEYVDTLVVIPSSGTFNVQGFAEDSAGRRGTTAVVTVTIQSVATDNAVPVVAHRIATRVEVDDTIHVRAQDPSAISWVGFRVDTNGVLLKFDSVNVAAGNLTDVTRHFQLGLAGLQPLPRTIVVRGYACDAATARNCSFTNSTTLIPSAPFGPGAIAPVGPQPGAAALIDTVVVVNGITVGLAGAGSIPDAIYNGNRRELYLSNPAFNRVDVFQVANTSFVAGGITTAGGQPWGLAMWPRDTLGGYKDTLIVADIGGTQLSVVNVGVGGPRQLLWRQNLPNYIVQTYKVVPQPGGATEVVTPHDLSDLPQYVATVCRPNAGGGPPCAADSVFALYSTSPTVSSTSPFNGRATLRMEKLINTTNPALMYGKFFWEIGTTSFSSGTDTLRIVLHRGRSFAKVVLSACAGITIKLDNFGLGDRTFARNSGNFTHAFFGEGGNVAVQFARVMSYDARNVLFQGTPSARSCNTGNAQSDSGENDVDFGMSPGIDVSDFISNTGIRVQSIATNFNGQTNAVRADSIYYLDQDLRRKATSAAPPGTGPGTPGMDMNYNHDFGPSGACPPTNTSCGGGTNKDDRIIFSANPNGNIDVFDTYFGVFMSSLAVRDPIIGPLRVAKDNVTGEQLLFGITANGLLVLRIPAFTNLLPAPPTGGP